MNKRWLMEILKMQEVQGCYRATRNLEENVEDMLMARRKRTANVIEFGCMDHTTGLAASALSAFLNYYCMTNVS